MQLRLEEDHWVPLSVKFVLVTMDELDGFLLTGWGRFPLTATSRQEGAISAVFQKGKASCHESPDPGGPQELNTPPLGICSHKAVCLEAWVTSESDPCTQTRPGTVTGFPLTVVYVVGHLMVTVFVGSCGFQASGTTMSLVQYPRNEYEGANVGDGAVHPVTRS